MGSRREADHLTTALDRWVGEDPYGMLVDCGEMVDVDAGWRTTWGEYFKENRDQATLAWYGANARIRLIVLMFRKGTGVHGRAFAMEEEARRWIEGQVSPP